jgi:peptide deformylase
MSKDLAAKTAVTVAAGLATPMDPIDEMELEKMRKVVERRQAFDRAVDKVLKERIPAQGRKGHVLPLRLHPDLILSQVCEPIEEFDKITGGSRKGLIADMAFTMYLCGGAGLAAPQVGLPYRLFVMDVEARAKAGSNLRVFINPEVISAANLIRMEEGCLSMPGLRPRIVRHSEVHVRAYTRKGKQVEQKLSGWNARVFLHELDHLEGKTMLDRLPPMELKLAQKKLRKIQRHIEGKVKNRKKGRR